jgi:hypothetical protein
MKATVLSLSINIAWPWLFAAGRTENGVYLYFGPLGLSAVLVRSEKRTEQEPRK